MIIRLPIDTKSLYFNITNDNEKGHTPTVATPLKQGNSIHKELASITEITEVPEGNTREVLTDQILKSSRADAIIPHVYVFSSFSVNNIDLPTDCSYCVYVREETNPKNVHCGRQKVHYPQRLYYEDLDVLIDNKSVLKRVSELLKNYAFIVDAFEYNTETKVLNFDITIVGNHGTPYSKVFVNKKGVGNKHTLIFNETADAYDMEIIALRKHYGYNNVFPENYREYIKRNDKTACDIVENYLLEKGASHIKNMQTVYPYSLYDFTYYQNGIKYYAIVKQSATKISYFNLGVEKIRFINDFSRYVKLFFVKDILVTKELCEYTSDQLTKMEKRIQTVTYTNIEGCK